MCLFRHRFALLHCAHRVRFPEVRSASAPLRSSHAGWVDARRKRGKLTYQQKLTRDLLAQSCVKNQLCSAGSANTGAEHSANNPVLPLIAAWLGKKRERLGSPAAIPSEAIGSWSHILI